MTKKIEPSTVLPVVWEAGDAGGADQREDLRESVLGLAGEGLPVSVWAAPPGSGSAHSVPTLPESLERLEGEPPVDGNYISVIHSNPGELVRDEAAGCCIGRTAVGTLRVTEPWAAAAGALDEIWVPSSFSRMALAASGVPEEMIQIVPSCIDAETFRPPEEPLPVDRGVGFVFITALDWDYLRGLDVVLEAYFREFRSDEEVTLVLKAPEGEHSSAVWAEGARRDSHWSDLEPWLLGMLRERGGIPEREDQYETIISAVSEKQLLDELRSDRAAERKTENEINDAVRAEMKRSGADLPEIKVVSRALPRSILPRLYSACDAFVMAPRAELWGRPFLESMAVGLPTIGTRWGGHLDFMRPDNSFLIRVRSLLNIDDDDRLGCGGQRLAEPDVQHLRELMRRVYEHRSEARERAALGSVHVRTRNSRARIASLMSHRLMDITGELELAVAEAA
jgi:glycosyltransferase involved in cell wall biosynthesis